MSEKATHDISARRMQLTGEIDYFFKSSNARFELITPCNLAVKTKDGKSSKRSHIGGEYFQPARASVGKRGAIIYEMKPLQACDYDWIEVASAEAKLVFGASFVEFMSNNNFDLLLLQLVKDAKEEASIVKEMKGNEEKKDSYAKLGWGNW